MVRTTLALGAVLVSPALAILAPQVDSYRFVAIPDTQSYTSAANEGNFRAMVQWVIDREPSDNVAFVTHVGDIVNRGASGTNQNEQQWLYAAAALGLLENGPYHSSRARIPYSVAIGNRDYDVISEPSQGTSRYREFFGEHRYVDEPWYLGASPDELVHAQRFDTPAGPWLHIVLDWTPSDESLLRAQQLITRDPGIPIIVTTHEHLGSGANAAWRTNGATRDSTGTNDAAQVYRKLIEPNPAISLLYCGHIGNGGYRTDQTIFGRDVHQILTCYQGDPNGGNGWLLTTEIDEAASVLRGQTTSPTYVSGTTIGPDRSVDPRGNFELNYDSIKHRDTLESTRVLHLREGLPGFNGEPWYGTVDTFIGSGAAGTTGPNDNNGDEPIVRAGLATGVEQGLLAFPSMIGAGSKQLPPDAVLRQAILTLTVEGPGAGTFDGGTVHRMEVPWNDDDSWSSLVDGVQVGAECRLDPSFSVTDQFSGKGTYSFDVTEDVRAWLTGVPNHGWVVFSAGADEWSFRSSEWEGVMERPQLTIVYEVEAPGPSRFCVARTNSTGRTGTLVVDAPWTQSTPDLQLGATHLPPMAVGILIAAQARFAAPALDGRLCVDPTSLRRISTPAQADANGTVDYQVDMATSAAMLTLTDRWCFQAWHRDTSALGSNFTDGVEIRFRN